MENGKELNHEKTYPYAGWEVSNSVALIKFYAHCAGIFSCPNLGMYKLSYNISKALLSL